VTALALQASADEQQHARHARKRIDSKQLMFKLINARVAINQGYSGLDLFLQLDGSKNLANLGYF
jgi:hypothetical protein